MRWTDAGSEQPVSLRLARQACDLLMVDKAKLLGPDAAEWREAFCPALSARRVAALVAGFAQSPAAPEQHLSPEVLAALEADARAAGRARVAAFPEVAEALLEAPSAPLPQALSEARPPAPPGARCTLHSRAARARPAGSGLRGSPVGFAPGGAAVTREALGGRTSRRVCRAQRRGRPAPTRCWRRGRPWPSSGSDIM